MKHLSKTRNVSNQQRIFQNHIMQVNVTTNCDTPLMQHILYKI
jgi:hypothetical protein